MPLKLVQFDNDNLPVINRHLEEFEDHKRRLREMEKQILRLIKFNFGHTPQHE